MRVFFGVLGGGAWGRTGWKKLSGRRWARRRGRGTPQNWKAESFLEVTKDGL